LIILLELGELFFANSNCSQECKYDNCRDMELKIPHLFVFKHPQPFSVSCKVSYSRTIKIHLSSPVFSVYYPNDKCNDLMALRAYSLPNVGKAFCMQWCVMQSLKLFSFSFFIWWNLFS
jgi:hypothetical protein